jgi:hypothetical protein
LSGAAVLLLMAAGALMLLLRRLDHPDTTRRISPRALVLSKSRSASYRLFSPRLLSPLSVSSPVARRRRHFHDGATRVMSWSAEVAAALSFGDCHPSSQQPVADQPASTVPAFDA